MGGETFRLDGGEHEGRQIMAYNDKGAPIDGPPMLKWAGTGTAVKTTAFKIRHGQFVDPNGALIEDLVGAMFTIRSVGTTGKDWIVKIKEASWVKTWGLTNRLVRAYDFEIQNDSSGKPTPLCEFKRKWSPRPRPRKKSAADQELEKTVTDRILPADEKTTLALVIGNEKYVGETASVDRSVVTKNWFSFACAGSALAKLRLMDYDPDPRQDREVLKSTPEDRQAALRMLTATYCGGTKYTVADLPLDFEDNDAATDYDRRAEAPTEARWNKDGATCLSRPRLFTTEKLPDDVTRGLSEKACLAAIREECRVKQKRVLPTCGDPVEWESSTPTK